jgi:hypothetical protein
MDLSNKRITIAGVFKFQFAEPGPALKDHDDS